MIWARTRNRNRNLDLQSATKHGRSHRFAAHLLRSSSAVHHTGGICFTFRRLVRISAVHLQLTIIRSVFRSLVFSHRLRLPLLFRNFRLKITFNTIFIFDLCALFLFTFTRVNRFCLPFSLSSFYCASLVQVLKHIVQTHTLTSSHTHLLLIRTSFRNFGSTNTLSPFYFKFESSNQVHCASSYCRSL